MAISQGNTITASDITTLKSNVDALYHGAVQHNWFPNGTYADVYSSSYDTFVITDSPSKGTHDYIGNGIWVDYANMTHITSLNALMTGGFFPIRGLATINMRKEDTLTEPILNAWIDLVCNSYSVRFNSMEIHNSTISIKSGATAFTCTFSNVTFINSTLICEDGSTQVAFASCRFINCTILTYKKIFNNYKYTSLFEGCNIICYDKGVLDVNFVLYGCRLLWVSYTNKSNMPIMNNSNYNIVSYGSTIIGYPEAISCVQKSNPETWRGNTYVSY